MLFASWDDLSRRNQTYGASVLATLTHDREVCLDTFSIAGIEQVEIYARRIDMGSAGTQPLIHSIEFTVFIGSSDQPEAKELKLSLDPNAFCNAGPFDLIEMADTEFVHLRMIEEVAAGDMRLTVADLPLLKNEPSRAWF